MYIDFHNILLELYDFGQRSGVSFHVLLPITTWKKLIQIAIPADGHLDDPVDSEMLLHCFHITFYFTLDSVYAMKCNHNAVSPMPSSWVFISKHFHFHSVEYNGWLFSFDFAQDTALFDVLL